MSKKERRYSRDSEKKSLWKDISYYKIGLVQFTSGIITKYVS